VLVRARLIVGGLWLTTIVVTVVAAYGTRSTFAEVNGLGGVLIVGSCCFVVVVTSALIRSALVLGAAGLVAACIGSMVAWNVLHDQSSTAALGVIAPAVASGLVAFVGIGVDAIANARRTHSP
jgi:hypothetical protein